jgi:hypothetical protein
MPFYLDNDRRRIGWSGSTHDEEAQESLIAYRLYDGGIVYAEPEFGSRGGYNEGVTYFNLNAAIEFLPESAKKIYDGIVKDAVKPFNRASLLALDRGYWEGVPAIWFSFGDEFESARWFPEADIVDRWITTRSEVRKIQLALRSR